MKYVYLALITLVILQSCQDASEQVDMIIHNATIYTAQAQDSIYTALAIRGDRIWNMGTNEEILNQKTAETKVIDANGRFVMPGFIEGHGHFSGLGSSLQELNFLKDTSWAAILHKIQSKVKDAEPGEWIYGRGWHQEKWHEQPENAYGTYPTHHTLSEISPDNPVMLIHASGHSLFANKLAMKQAGISKETGDPDGGHILKDAQNEPIGVFEERAMQGIKAAYQAHLSTLNEEELVAKWYTAIDLAQQECLKHGVTSFQDAGASKAELRRYVKLAEDNKMDIRLWSMIRHSYDEMKDDIATYRYIGTTHNHFTCAAIKTEVDGALGAHGAWLLEPYNDKPEFYGQNTTDIDEVKRIAKLAYDNEMQLCVHAIGDRANKEVLDIIQSYNTKKKGLRWRIEHAQHLNPGDIMRFKNTGALASMQGVHCTSDAPFVVKRLGMLRAKVGAYAWKALLQQGVTIINGTDVPVEELDPIKNFHATVTRTRIDNGMTFFVEQKLTREEALRSYTIAAAYGAFEEDIKGSLETGKLADIIMLDHNLLSCSDTEILETAVDLTIVGGQIKYERD